MYRMSEKPLISADEIRDRVATLAREIVDAYDYDILLSAIPYISRTPTSNNLSIGLQGRTLNINFSGAAPTATVSVALFDMLGHKVASLAQGNLPAGSTVFNLDGIASGHYIVRANVGGASYAMKISIK